MGGDGQALVNKRSLLESHNVYNAVQRQTSSKQHEEQQQQSSCNRENLIQWWTHCALTLEPLEAPIVFDLAGNLYSKYALQERIERNRELQSLEKSSVCDHEEETCVPSKMSSVREISGDSLTSSNDVKCAMTNVTNRTGVHPFVGFWKCGHVVLQSTICTSQATKSHSDNTYESECPFCGESSIYVQLVLSDSKAAALQQRKLYRRLRKMRKRSRSEQ